MKKLTIGATILALLASPVAIAQPGGQRDHRGETAQRDHRSDGPNHGGQWRNGRWYHENGRYDNGRHRGWSRDRGHGYNWGRGQRMGYNDWRYAQRIDYRHYNLRRPPRGYEWRRSDDRFLMVAIASGIIASVVLSNRR